MQNQAVILPVLLKPKNKSHFLKPETTSVSAGTGVVFLKP
jgi:hypothetical protein